MDYWAVQRIIDDLRIHSHPGPRTWKMKASKFAHESHSNWALCELELYLLKHDGEKNIYDLIEDFRYLMDNYACNAKTPETNFMFSVAYDVTTEVLDAMLVVDQAFGR